MDSTAEARREYQRWYRQTHKAKAREYRIKYNAKHKIKRRAYQIEYGKKHRKKAKVPDEINVRQSVKLAYTASDLMTLPPNKATVAINQILSGERSLSMRIR